MKNRKSSRIARRGLKVVAAVAVGAVAQRAMAVNYVWDGFAGTGNWSTQTVNAFTHLYTTNWGISTSPLLPPSSSTTSVEFSTLGSGTTVQDLAGTFTLSAMTFDSGAASFTVMGNALDFRDNGSTAAAITQNSSNLQSISTAIGLDGSFAANINGSGGLNLSGVVSGTGGMKKTGNGTLTISGNQANTFTGLTDVTAGELDLNKSGAIGGDLTIDGGTVMFSSSNALSSSSTLTINGGGNFSSNPAQTLGRMIWAGGSGSSGGNGWTLTSTAQYALVIAGDYGYFSDYYKLTGATGGGIQVTGTTTFAGAIDLGGVAREVNVGGNLLLSANLVNGGIDKSGSGTLTITGGTIASPRTLTNLQLGGDGSGNTYLDSGGAMTLTATGSTGFGGDSSLFIEGGNTLTVRNGFTLETLDTPQLHNSAQMIVDGANTSWVNAGHLYDLSQIRVGFAGGTSTLTVQNGASVTTPNLLVSWGPYGGKGIFNLTSGAKAIVWGELMLSDNAQVNINGGLANVGYLDDYMFNTASTDTIALTDPSSGVALTVGSANVNSTFGGSISGSGTLNKVGTATLTLTGWNTYSHTIVNNGVLMLGSGGAVGGDVVVNSGGTLRLGADLGIWVDAGNQIAHNVTLNGGTFDLQYHDEAVNSLTMTGNSSVTGPADWYGLGLYNPNGRAIYATGSSNTISSNLYLYPSTSNPGARTIYVDSNSNLEIDGQIWDGYGSGGSGSMIKDGAGTLVLGGTYSNFYTGSTTMAAGGLDLNKSVAIPGDLTLNGGMIKFNAANALGGSTTLTQNGGQYYSAADQTLGRYIINGGGGSGVDSVVWTLTSTAQYALAINVDGGSTWGWKFTGASGGGITYPYGGALNGTVDFGGVTREINAGGDLTVSSFLSNGGVYKTGTGTVKFTGGTSGSPMVLTTFQTTGNSDSTVMAYGAMTLTATGQTGSGTDSSLFVEGGSTLTVQNGFTLRTTDTPQMHNNSTMIVDGANTTWTNVANGNDFAQIRVGLFGATSKLTVQNGATVTTPNLLVGWGFYGGTGQLNVTSGAKVNIAKELSLSDNSSVAIDRATVTTGYLQDHYAGTAATASMTITDPVGSSALVFNTPGYSFSYYNGSLTDGLNGPGGITFNGPGEQILSNATYSGPTTVNGGYLVIQNQTHTGSFTNNGGQLEFDYATLTPGLHSLTANANSSITYYQSTINGGFIRGTGFQYFSGSQINGSTINPGANLSMYAGNNTLTNVTSSGILQSYYGSTTTWDGGLQTAAGKWYITGTANSDQFENDGTIYIEYGATLNNTQSSLVNGGGASMNIQSGATLNLNNTSLDLHGAQLINDGTINAGTTNIYFGSVAQGGGKFGAINLWSGGTFTPADGPGSATSGSMNWAAGGTYLFELKDAVGIPGAGWDVLHINGDLLLLGTATNPLLVDFMPLNPSDFDINQDYQWLIADVTGNIYGFDAKSFVVENPTALARHDGYYTVEQQGNGLYLVYDPISVPEPTGVAMMGVALMGLKRRRRD